MKILILAAVVVLIWQFVCWLVYGGGDDGERIPREQIRRERRRIAKMFFTDRNDARVVHTTIGWRPDPWNHGDGFTEVKPNEYERTIRDGKDY